MCSTFACSAPEAAVYGIVGAVIAAFSTITTFLIVTGRQVVNGQRKPYR